MESKSIDWKAYCRSLADFVIAQLRHDTSQDELLMSAGSVIVLKDGVPVSIHTLVEKAARHGWNSMIYEAWSWEFGNQIQRIANTLPLIYRDALLTYAKSHGDLDIGHDEAYAAIRDAQRELYGEGAE